MKKLLITLMSIVIVTLGIIYVNRMRPVYTKKTLATAASFNGKEHPVAKGTFIQSWLVKDWDDQDWIKEYQALKEAGMEYIVLSPTAFEKKDDKTGLKTVQTIYPTKIKEFQNIGEDSQGMQVDIVEACLKNAQEAGIKVFLGLNFSDEWWSKRNDTAWIFDRVEEGNKIADELWNRYRSKYPDAFYGWYWCWEVDNANFRSFDLINSKKLLADAIKLQLEHLENTGKRLPFMLAPYMDWKLSTPGGYARMWEYVFKNSGMKAGDIFAPQDGIGAGGLSFNNYAKWFSELRKAVDSKPGIQMWATIETFDIKDWTAATMDRLIRQLTDLRQYVDDYVTFAYSHYYSPNIIVPGFHRIYTEYVKTGSIEAEPPSTPTNLKVDAVSQGKALISWNNSVDNVGVCGYYVFRNGKKIYNLQVKRKGNKTTIIMDAETAMTDSRLEPGKSYAYEVQAYDFAGNVSSKAGPVVITAK